MKIAAVLTLAALAALPACSSVDESAPTHPRTAEILGPSQNEKDNADKRALENPKHEVPTGSGAEYPGQSLAPAAAPAVLASSQDGSLKTEDAARVLTLGSFQTPSDAYDRDSDTSDIPHLPERPGTTYQTGNEPVPDTPWLIDNSWGNVLPLQSATHRAWPEMQTHYYNGSIKNNPVYYFNLQEHLNVPQNDGTPVGNLISTAYEVPWFLATTAALPVLMVIDPPLAQRTTVEGSYDPNYRGFLSAQGNVAPTPQPGVIRWDYSFLKKNDQPSPTEPAGAPLPGVDVPNNTTNTSLPAIIPVPTTTVPNTATDVPPATQP